MGDLNFDDCRCNFSDDEDILRELRHEMEKTNEDLRQLRAKHLEDHGRCQVSTAQLEAEVHVNTARLEPQQIKGNEANRRLGETIASIARDLHTFSSTAYSACPEDEIIRKFLIEELKASSNELEVHSSQVNGSASPRTGSVDDKLRMIKDLNRKLRSELCMLKRSLRNIVSLPGHANPLPCTCSRTVPMLAEQGNKLHQEISRLEALLRTNMLSSNMDRFLNEVANTSTLETNYDVVERKVSTLEITKEEKQFPTK